MLLNLLLLCFALLGPVTGYQDELNPNGNILRLNFGTAFIFIEHITVVQDWWYSSFQLDLPPKPTLTQLQNIVKHQGNFVPAFYNMGPNGPTEINSLAKTRFPNDNDTVNYGRIYRYQNTLKLRNTIWKLIYRF